MAILDGSGRRINPNKRCIKIGDLGELKPNKEWRKFLFETRDGREKE